MKSANPQAVAAAATQLEKNLERLLLQTVVDLVKASPELIGTPDLGTLRRLISLRPEETFGMSSALLHLEHAIGALIEARNGTKRGRS